MPDDESDPTGDIGTGGDQTEAAPQFAPDHDSDEQNPRPGSDESPVTPQQIQEQHKAVYEALDGLRRQQEKTSDSENRFLLELQGLREQAALPPIAEKAPIELPPPPDQQQKFSIGTLVTNGLKLGALISLAYGLRGRSPIRNSLFKLGLASALNSYHEGRMRDRNQTLALWEKNRQFIMDQNREQHQRFVDHVNNEKTDWRQKHDIISKEAEFWQNKRMQDAALRQDWMAIQKTLTDEMNAQRAIEKQIRDDREQWWKHLGLTGVEGLQYRDWVLEQGGPDISKANADQANAIESKYPRHKMIEQYQKQKDQKEIEQEEKKARTKARVAEEKRLKEFPEKMREEEQGAAARERGRLSVTQPQGQEPTQQDLDAAGGVLKDLLKGVQ